MNIGLPLVKLLFISLTLIASSSVKNSSAQNIWVEIKSEQAEALGATGLMSTDGESGNSCAVIHLPKNEVQGERLLLHAFVVEGGENLHFTGLLMMSPYSKQIAMLLQKPVEKQVGDTWKETGDKTPRIFAQYCSQSIKSLPKKMKELFYGLFEVDEPGETKEKPKPPPTPKPESPICRNPCYTQQAGKETL